MICGILEAMLVTAAVGHTNDDFVTPGHNPEPPLTIIVTGPDKVAGPRDLELVLEIQRTLPDDVPIGVHIALPDGVELLGASDFAFVDQASTVIARRLRFHVARQPEGDVVVTVDARGRTYGVHAAASYTFGRKASPPRRTPLGPELWGPGGTRLGRPVVVDRSAPARIRQ